MVLTFKDIAEILKIIDASQCEEVVIELEGLRLVVRRGNAQAASTRSVKDALEKVQADSPIAEVAGPRMAKRFGSTSADLSQGEGRVAVRAPMVGSFFRRPSPDQPPFIEVGQKVMAGDPLCLIGVMKLFTTIASPADGVIEAIAVDDASPVEFDQLLLVIRPD